MRSLSAVPLVFPDGPKLSVVPRGRSRTPVGMAALDVEALLRENEALKHALSEMESFRTLAYRDELSGLWNRRYFDERLDEELSRARRDSRRRVSVMVVDVNDLKVINDARGHLAGDQAIRWVGAFLRESLRAHDVCCRIGGDEFAVIIPDADTAECQALITRFRRLLREANQNRQAQVEMGPLHQMGLSLGTATFPSDATGRRGLVAQADEAMYRDKRRQKVGPATTATASTDGVAPTRQRM